MWTTVSTCLLLVVGVVGVQLGAAADRRRNDDDITLWLRDVTDDVMGGGGGHFRFGDTAPALLLEEAKRGFGDKRGLGVALKCWTRTAVSALGACGLI